MRLHITATFIVCILGILIITGCVSDNRNETPGHIDSAGEAFLSDNISDTTKKHLTKAPSLTISYSSGDSLAQDIQALQLTTSWSYVDGSGNGSGYEADSPHPLQLDDYSDATLDINGAGGEIVLLFNDNYPPQYISVQRWEASYATGSQDIMDVLDKSIPIEVDAGKITINGDGNCYIYEIYARWEDGSSTGSSYYAFRVDRVSVWTPLSELPVDYSAEQAIEDGVFVRGMEIFNQELADKFHENVSAGDAAFMRVMQHTIEGDAIITDYHYDGSIFTVHNDTTRDKFGVNNIAVMTYKHLICLDWSSPISYPKPYYVLSNAENVYIEDNSGINTDLIDDLFWVPSPSIEKMFDIGSVTISSNGTTYEPYIHFMFMKIDNLLLDGIDFNLKEISQNLQLVEYGNDFAININGNGISSHSYTLYDDTYSIIYNNAEDFIKPSKAGLHLLCVDITWSNTEPGTGFFEYVGNRYVFKIKI